MKSRRIPHISIIPAIEKTTNDGAVNYINNYLQQQHLASTEILDLQNLRFPIQKLEKPGKELKSLVKKIKSSAGILIVASEFEGEYPAHLRNMIDFLYDQWDHKPVAISTVANDEAHQAQIIRSLQFSLWKVNSWTVPVSFEIPLKIEASRSSDVHDRRFEIRQANDNPIESEFQAVFNNYCNKYIQLCTRVEYAV
jgi:NAD(P)H-dependent FMN reductase